MNMQTAHNFLIDIILYAYACSVMFINLLKYYITCICYFIIDWVNIACIQGTFIITVSCVTDIKQ